MPGGDIAAYVKSRPIKDTDLAALSPEEIPDAFLDAVTEEEIPLSYCLGLLRGHAVILPLWLYDHSGISMSCGERTYPYDDRWDSGQVGWIAVTRKDAMENLGVRKPDGSWAMAGESDWEKAAIDCIRAEVETYDQYLTGDIYWYELKSRPEAESGDLDTDSDG